MFRKKRVIVLSEEKRVEMNETSSSLHSI